MMSSKLLLWKCLPCAVIATLLQACAGLDAAPTGPPSPEGIPRLEHVIVIVMENKSYDQVRNHPFIQSLIQGGSSFTNSYALTHPSQPNYLALWSGGFQGVSGDRCPATATPLTTPNLGQACEAAGLTWKTYSEDLPAAGSSVCSATGGYVRRHDPWTNFGNLNHANERPYPDLATDIASGSLPNLAFVIPNLCHDMHDCSVSLGDSWLSANVPPMLAAVGAGGIVVVTWDEDDNDAGNHILTVFAGTPVRAGYASPRFINHYTLLRTICETLGLAPFGNAAQDSAITDVWDNGTFNPPGEESTRVRLSLAYPVPSSTAISSRLQLPIQLHVTAGVFDVTGRQVRALVDGPLSGDVDLRWDGRNDDGGGTAGGVYFLRVYAGDVLFERRLVRVK